MIKNLESVKINSKDEISIQKLLLLEDVLKIFKKKMVKDLISCIRKIYNEYTLDLEIAANKIKKENK